MQNDKCRLRWASVSLKCSFRTCIPASDSVFLRIPFEPQFRRRRHVADERRCGDDSGAREVAFTAESHPVLPVAIERRDGALAAGQRVRALAEAGAAPRLANLAADRS